MATVPPLNRGFRPDYILHDEFQRTDIGARVRTELVNVQDGWKYREELDNSNSS